MRNSKQNLYEAIAEDLGNKIKSGFYRHGEKLPSRNELCEKYNISEMTAYRVQNTLFQNGLLSKVKGKGVFANNSESLKTAYAITSSSPKIQRVVCFCFCKNQVNPGTIMLKGVQAQAFESGINIRCEFINNRISMGAWDIADDEGVIIISNSRDCVLPLLAEARIKSVCVDNLFAHSYCVLNDNHSGIVQLLDHLETKKCRKIVLATKKFDSLGLANRSERIFTFENEAKRRGLDAQVDRSGDFNKLLELACDSNRPDAIMFTSDEPALKFKKMIEELNVNAAPVITGFNDFSNGTRDLAGLTTIRTDFEELGKTAVKVVLNTEMDDWLYPEILRVPCQLVVRD